MAGRVDGKIAIVTGAARGNGEGIARALIREGAKVYLWDRLDLVYDTAKAIDSSGTTAVASKTDVSVVAQVNKAFKDIIEADSRVDILVNNAGVGHLAPFVECGDDILDDTFANNFRGCWNCCKAAVPGMLAQGYGKVVNISSVTGPRVTHEGLSAYSASKGAVSGFTRGLALETAKNGITVNAILPGFIDTPMSRAIADLIQMDPEEFVKECGKGVPMGRMGLPEDIGDLALFLACDESRYITGQEFIIDGGNIIQEEKKRHD